MYQEFITRYGRLTAVEPSGGNRIRLVFENGTVERPPLMTYGYRGTGVDNLRAFLAQAGLDASATAGIDDPEWPGVSIP
jgi:hypothetical protein